ncbi:MAG: hypothetical protein IJW53_06375 [Clostridia bacterium]|nr:hypothetical protein [Clostridia bacterium]
MDKKNLLDRIREENEADDPFEREALALAMRIGGIVALAMCLIIFYLEWMILGKYNLGLFIVPVSILTVKNVIMSIKLKETSTIICSVIYSILLIVLIIVYIIAFLNGWI